MILGACARLTSTTVEGAARCNDVVEVNAASHEVVMAVFVVLGGLVLLVSLFAVRRITR